MRIEVQTSGKKGPSKLRLRAREPYRVLEQLSENTYWIQRIPFQKPTSKHVYAPYKETAARMEKLPSRLVIHKHTDGVDSNWVALNRPYAEAPLQNVIGAPEFGTFQATKAKGWASEQIKELWEEELPSQCDDNTNAADKKHDPCPGVDVRGVRKCMHFAEDMQGGSLQEVKAVTPETGQVISTPPLPKPQPKKLWVVKDAPDKLGFGSKKEQLTDMAHKNCHSQDKLLLISFQAKGMSIKNGILCRHRWKERRPTMN